VLRRRHHRAEHDRGRREGEGREPGVDARVAGADRARRGGEGRTARRAEAQAPRDREPARAGGGRALLAGQLRQDVRVLQAPDRLRRAPGPEGRPPPRGGGGQLPHEAPVGRAVRSAGVQGARHREAGRFGKYYGWVPVRGSGTRESIESDDAIARACVEEAARDAPGERYADHDSPEWRAFYEANKLDCELYEIVRSTWRAQIQTIIPLTLQKRRAGEGDDDEKEDDEEEEGGGAA